MKWLTRCLLACSAWLGLMQAAAQAGEVQVAVAANFAAPMARLAKLFEAQTGHKAVVATGATGAFAAQIRNGAPFEVLLAADADTPIKLERERLGVVGSRMNYAVGKLVLWSPQAGLVDDKGAVLRTMAADSSEQSSTPAINKLALNKLALANPKLAPYGAAAVQTLSRMGLLTALEPKFVLGENIAQTYQFVASGNAPLGFVALSQVMVDGRMSAGSAWVVPAELYEPLRQDALLLLPGQNNPAAHALLEFLGSNAARYVIRSFGYGLTTTVIRTH